MPVKNLIFDLGGVIIDLSVDHTLHAFSEISGIEKAKVISLYASTPGFEAYEKGLMNDDEFRDFIRDVFAVDASKEEIDACWNAMLLGLPANKLQLLLDLKNKYRVFLLSNTNSIHIDYVNHTMLPGVLDGMDSLDAYFHRAHYSHVMKKRKPNADIFAQVLEENDLLADQTLFLDDNTSNLEGAQQLGIKTVLVDTPNFILDYFHEQ